MCFPSFLLVNALLPWICPIKTQLQMPRKHILLSDSCSAACAAVNDAARFFQLLQAPQQKNWWLAVGGELTEPDTQCCSGLHKPFRSFWLNDIRFSPKTTSKVSELLAVVLLFVLSRYLLVVATTANGQGRSSYRWKMLALATRMVGKSRQKTTVCICICRISACHKLMFIRLSE